MWLACSSRDMFDVYLCRDTLGISLELPASYIRQAVEILINVNQLRFCWARCLCWHGNAINHASTAVAIAEAKTHSQQKLV